MKKTIFSLILVSLIFFACHKKIQNNPIDKAVAKADRENYTGALKDIDAVIKNDTTNTDAYFSRAFNIKEKTDDFQGAIADYTKAIEIRVGDSINDSRAYCNRGHAKFMLKDYKGALEDLQQAINLNADDPYIYRNRALVFIAIKNTGMICFDLKKALDLGFTRKYGKEVENLVKEYCK
jgi:tetratricopeptide (TPR) repeat protein